MELKRLVRDEDGEKKSKSLILKVEDSDSDGVMYLIVNNFNRFLRHEKGHIRLSRPLAKKENQNLKKSNKHQKKGKKSYIAWEDNDMEP